jgi:hypothetical protein
MPRTPAPRPTGRAVFISHATTDAEIVNDFVDNVLTKGIGISHEHIFNVSAKTSPMRAGGNFSPDIRSALRIAKVVIAVVTPTYLERPFTMAELGAAWAADTLIPILVPPIDFDTLEGVLSGVQCIRITDKVRIAEIYDRFDLGDLNKERWFTRVGVATFNEHLNVFMQSLSAKVKTVVSPPKATAHALQVTQSAAIPQPSLPNPKDELREFERRVVEFRSTLSKLPYLVRIAFMYEARDEEAIATPKTDDELNKLAYQGLINIHKRSQKTANGQRRSIRCFSPTNSSQRSRDVYTQLTGFKEFLTRASPAFHHYYEENFQHIANLKLFPFWEENDLLTTATD